MKIRYAFALIFCVGLSKASLADTIASPIKIDDLMVNEFKSRSNIKKFQESSMPFSSSEYYIVFGGSSQNGLCSESGEAPSMPNPLPENMVFATIDILFDPSSCERLVKAGFIETKHFNTLLEKRLAQGVIEATSTYHTPSPNPATGLQHTSINQEISTPLLTQLIINTPSSSTANKNYTATDGVGIYYEYSDSGAPPFGRTGYSIPVAWAQASLQFGSDICLGGIIAARFKTFHQIATGWEQNKSAPPPTGYLNTKCNYYCVGNTCNVTGYDFDAKTAASFTNPGIQGFLSNGLSGGFPSCFGTVTINFSPAGIRTTRDGGASDVSNSSIFGPMARCTAWQQNLRIMYTGISYAYARSTLSPTNPSGGLPFPYLP